jgi:hypothetical protein
MQIEEKPRGFKTRHSIAPTLPVLHILDSRKLSKKPVNRRLKKISEARVTRLKAER